FRGPSCCLPLGCFLHTSVRFRQWNYQFLWSRCHSHSECDAPSAPGLGAASSRLLIPLQTTRSTRLPRSSTSPPITTRLTMNSKDIRHLRVLGTVHHRFHSRVTRSSTCEEKWTIQGPW